MLMHKDVQPSRCYSDTQCHGSQRIFDSRYILRVNMYIIVILLLKMNFNFYTYKQQLTM